MSLVKDLNNLIEELGEHESDLRDSVQKLLNEKYRPNKQATLYFNTEDPYVEEDLHICLNGHRYKNCLDEVWNKVFRPNRKHGYGNDALDNDQAYDVIEKLIEIYQEVLKDSLGDIDE